MRVGVRHLGFVGALQGCELVRGAHALALASLRLPRPLAQLITHEALVARLLLVSSQQSVVSSQ